MVSHAKGRRGRGCGQGVGRGKAREGEEGEGMWSGSRERGKIRNIIKRIYVRPIFHCDAKTLTLGCCIGQYPHRESFRWGYQHVGI